MTEFLCIIGVIVVLILIGPWIVKFYTELFRELQKGE